MTLTTTPTKSSRENSASTEPPGGSEALEEVESATAELVGTVFHLGRLWATHGLTVADRTLQAAADSLQATAKTLAELSRRIDGESSIDQ